MTDHNAEGGKKVEPCGLCGKPQILRFRPAVVIPLCDCFAPDGNDVAWGRDDWNGIQRRILEMRRRDFEAARETGYGFCDMYSTFDYYLSSTRK